MKDLFISEWETERSIHYDWNALWMYSKRRSFASNSLKQKQKDLA
jgi:hypothetical protein